MISEFIESPNGKIFIIRTEPTEVKATLILVHGLGEHIERYTPFVEYLAGFGIQTIGFDQRGFGRSVEVGHKKGYSTVIGG